jgi:hypothetical protein
MYYGNIIEKNCANGKEEKSVIFVKRSTPATGIKIASVVIFEIVLYE